MNSMGVKKSNSIISVLILMAMVVVCMSGTWSEASEYYTWPEYSPTVAYDYFDEYGEISPPTQVLDDVTNDNGDPVSTYIDGWWCFRWGSDANPAVTEDAWIPMLERFNDDFDYITNVMRWPRDKRALEGYYSTIYLYGSGLSTDDASNTDTGGWQGATWYDGQSWPMVLASYVPVVAFDPASYDGYQTGAMIHEGIHCILASMPGCTSACWFHEGGNTWLQGTMEAQRAGNFNSMGWLSVGAAIAPFMPIECYTGWLQDDSFGGPCAEGVNMFNGDQQICTWRNLLGGTQYGECFPHAMEVILGPKSVAWVWRYCSQSGRVLQDLAEVPGGLGQAQTRRLIQEYRARQAFCDFGPWSYAFRQLLNGSWNATIDQEWSPYWIDCPVWYATCYADTTQAGSVLTPEYRTLPGWSGANQVPLTVDAGATEATVTFTPIGANMSCQLVYRDTNGTVQYGVPVSSGACSIPLANVMNNVIVAVVCNTDYIYVDDSTRQTKYDYTLTLGAGVTGTADIYTQWYDYSPSGYTIVASAETNGTLSPSGNVSVNAGANQTFTFTPDSGYEVDEVILNGFPIGAMDNYTFNDVRGDHTISVTFSVVGAETDPPTPNPATWVSVPAATGTDTMAMTATTGSDASGTVEYYFEETSGNAGGSDSGWQSSPTYTDTGLSEGTQYTYRVQMRDAYSNTGAWSTSESAMTEFSGVMNIALIASVDTSYVSPWETLEAVNDGYTPANSADNSNGAYGNWDGTNGTWNWVEYDFGTDYQINSTDVYWWSDGGGIAQPTDAYIEYWNGSSWVNAGSIGLALDQWNTLVTNFTTSKMRINMVSTISTGILEWQVWGQVPGGGDTTPPAAPTGLTATAGDGSVSLDWADNGESDLAAYNVYRDTTSGGPYTQIAGSVSASDYQDSSVTNGTTYYYVVAAVDTSSNESGNSNEVSATPSAGNQPPSFTADPINEADATEDVAYSSTLADDASDPESDPMTFSKVSGPTWLTVASDGTLSGMPSAGDVGANAFTVQVTATGGSDTATLNITVDAASGGPVMVFTDSFENGEWNGLWTEDSQNDWFDSTQRSVDGSYSAEVDGSASNATLTSASMNLQGNSNATVTFSWLIERGFDSGEYLAFDVSTDGGSNWTQMAILQGNVDTENVWHNESIDVTGISSGNLQIRFRSTVSRSNEDANVDMVEVSAW